MAQQAASNQIKKILPQINGAGAVIDPELCFAVPVAVAVADAGEACVPATDPPVVCAAVAVAGEPPQYCSKYWDSTTIWLENSWGQY